MYNKLGSWDKIPLQCIRMLYNAFVPSVFGYGSEIWGTSITETEWKFAPEMRFLKSTLRLPKHSSHALLRSDFYLSPLRNCAIIAGTRQFLKMSESKNPLLSEAFFFLSSYKNEKRNFVRKLVDTLAKAKLEAVITSELPMDQKMEQVRTHFFNLTRENELRQIQCKTEYENCSYITTPRPLDSALSYFSFLPRPLAKTLFQIRANSLYKPFQYIMKSFSCLYCDFQPSNKSGWVMFKHHCLDCPAWKLYFRDLRAEEHSWEIICLAIQDPSSYPDFTKGLLARACSFRRKYASTKF